MLLLKSEMSDNNTECSLLIPQDGACNAQATRYNQYCWQYTCTDISSENLES